jgi:hypothetical protein
MDVITQGSPDWASDETKAVRDADRLWRRRQRLMAELQTFGGAERAMGDNPPKWDPHANEEGQAAYATEMRRRGARFGMKLAFRFWLVQTFVLLVALLAVLVFMVGTYATVEAVLGPASGVITVLVGLLVAFGLRFVWLARKTVLPVLSSLLRVHTGVPTSLGHRSDLVICLTGERLSKVKTTAFKVDPGSVSTITSEGYDTGKRWIAYYDLHTSNLYADIRSLRSGDLSEDEFGQRLLDWARAINDRNSIEFFEFLLEGTPPETEFETN